QITKITIGRTTVRNKDRIVKVEDHGHALPFDQPLEDRRAQQGSFAKDIDRIVLSRRVDDGKTARELARDVRQCSPNASLLIGQLVELFTLEWRVSDLYPALTQQAFPLLNPEPLTR